MEILVAVAVMGIVVLAALGGLATVRRTSDAIAANLDRSGNAPILLDRLRRDLEALVVAPDAVYRPPQIGDDPDPYRFYCEPTVDDPADFIRLEFASRCHLPLMASDLPGDARLVSRVAYFVRPDGDDGDGFTVLRAAVSDLRRGFGQAPTAAVVCRRVARLDYTFMDSDGDWRPEWNSDDRRWNHTTPRAVVVALEMLDGERYRLHVPLTVGRFSEG